MEIRAKRNREFIKDYRKERVCVLCGYSKHPEILVFHHVKLRKRFTKFKGISVMILSGTPIKKIKEEIQKCVLLCPNCHAWYHTRERNKKTKTPTLLINN